MALTDEMKKEILELFRDKLYIKISRDSDYYGHYTTTVGLYLLGEDYDELISESST